MKRTISSVLKATERQTCADLLTGEFSFLVLTACVVLGSWATVSWSGTSGILGMALGFLVFGAAAVSGGANTIKVSALRDSVGRPKGFTLSLGGEIVILNPGITWGQLDKYKWGARGLIDEPNLFRVLTNGSVEINGETISLGEPQGTEKLQREINKRHAVSVAQIARAHALPRRDTEPTQASRVGKVQFKVRLDRFGHIQIEYVIAGEREETGLRGIPALIANGLLTSPNSIHVDPMQRAIEIDGVRFECTEEGTKQLEESLNGRYAASSTEAEGIAIEVKENVVSPTGFDIRFMTFRAGMALEVKDHLSQENLDILTDQSKCDLLQPDIQLRLAPPYLLIRRRRPDMGEDKIPGLPDVNYIQVTAAQLRRILNHPAIRKGGGASIQEAPSSAECPTNPVEVRVIRHPTNKSLLWLHCITSDGTAGEGKALTHHNIADIQHHGYFLPHLDVCLSLDNTRLSILDRQTNHEEAISIDATSPDQVLVEAGRMLTKALKPVKPSEAPTRSEIKQVEPLEAPRFEVPSVMQDPVGTAPEARSKNVSSMVQIKPERESDPGVGALFQETDPVKINREIFQSVSRHFEIEPQDTHFNLPMVFEDRRFEILSFYEGEVEDLMQLRGQDFCGFYISHINENKQVLVYACNGAHIEWGPDRCLLQAASGAEAREYPAGALLGLARNKDEELVFVVQRAFKEWIRPFESEYDELLVHFCLVSDIACTPDDYSLIWPVVSA